MDMEKGKFIRNALFVIFFCEILLWILINTSTNFIRDFDFSNLLYHTTKMWEAKKLILPNWTYVSTGEWDCSSLLAMPLYGICGDMLKAFGIANIINVILFSVLVITLMKTAGAKEEYALLAIDIILLPYAAGMLAYTNMLFWGGAQYIYKVLTPIFLLVMLHKDFTQKLVRYLLTVVLLFLVFMTVTSSGLFVVICGIVPIIGVEVCFFLKNRRNLTKWQMILTGLVSITILLSMMVHQKWSINANSDTISLVELDRIWGNIYSSIMDNICIWEIFRSYKVSVMSAEGIKTLLKLFIYLFVLILGLKKTKRFVNIVGDVLHGKRDEIQVSGREQIQIELLAIAICNFLITVLTLSGSRYQLIGFIPLIIVAVMEYEETEFAGWVRYGFLILFCFLGFHVVKDFIEVYPETYYSKEVCYGIIDYAREHNIKQIISYNDTEWPQMLRGYAPDLDLITYYEEDEEFRDLDVYNGIKTLECFHDKSMIIVKNGVAPSVEGYTEDYEYVTYIGQFRIFIN